MTAASDRTPSGIPIVDCAKCGWRHPITRRHCPTCGKASLFGHGDCEVA